MIWGLNVTQSVTIVARGERLLELADLLRGREATTAGELAGELRVSRRTVLRDLAALRERGMPITGEAGRGGGLRLEGDRGVLAVHLSLSEIVAMWLAARLSRVASDLPWGAAANSGLAKLLSTLPAARARALRSLCRRVIVGPAASEATRKAASAAPPELLGLFEEAFSAGYGLGFQYADREGARSSRRVEPHGLLVTTPLWYILARDVEKGAPRMFRMDRISRTRLLKDVVFQPDLQLIRSMFTDASLWHPLVGEWS